jgi:hypothetical protein
MRRTKLTVATIILALVFFTPDLFRYFRMRMYTRSISGIEKSNLDNWCLQHKFHITARFCPGINVATQLDAADLILEKRCITWIKGYRLHIKVAIVDDKLFVSDAYYIADEL